MLLVAVVVRARVVVPLVMRVVVVHVRVLLRRVRRVAMAVVVALLVAMVLAGLLLCGGAVRMAVCSRAARAPRRRRGEWADEWGSRSPPHVSGGFAAIARTISVAPMNAAIRSAVAWFALFVF